MEITIRPALPTDLHSISALLQEDALPVVGVEDHLDSFLVAEGNGATVGAVGLELYGDTALLRSAVVVRSERGKGIGQQLYDAILAKARSYGIRRIILLTNTAEGYFARRGFRKIDQKSVTGPITSSVEFSGACPAHAVCMELRL